MAKGDDDEQRAASRARPAPRDRARVLELLGELYDEIDSPTRDENLRGPRQRLARDRRRARFIAAGIDVCRALALAVRGR